MDKKNEVETITEEVLFIQMVSMFQAAAMQHLGKMMNPITNKIEQDLDQAKISIDMIGMIKNKSQGNLGEEEEAFLDKVLFELRMNYVEEIDRLKKKMQEKEGRQEKSGGAKGGKEKASPSEQFDAKQADAKSQGRKAVSRASGKPHGRGGSGKKKGGKKKAKGRGN